jgi:hypothetical protein
MNWQMLIWNMFVWTFTGVMIYVKDASMWWLLLPALFTGFMNGAELLAKTEKQEDTSLQLFDMNPKTKKEFFELIIKSGKEDKKRERL